MERLAIQEQSSGSQLWLSSPTAVTHQISYKSDIHMTIHNGNTITRYEVAVKSFYAWELPQHEELYERVASHVRRVESC